MLDKSARLSNYQFEEIKNTAFLPKISFLGSDNYDEQIENDSDQENELRSNNILVSSSNIITKKRKPSIHQSQSLASSEQSFKVASP